MNLVDLVLRPPVFEDEDKTHSAALLHFILIVTTLTNALSLLWDAVSGGYNLAQLRDNILLLIAQIILLIWMRKGGVRQVGVVFVVFGWFIISYATYSNAGILNPLFGSLALLVLIAGLLVNEWVAVGFAILSILYGIWLVNAAEAGQYVNQVGEITARHAWSNYVSALALTAILLWISLRVMREARRRAKRNALALYQSEARYRALVDNAPSTILMVDRNHRISLVSRTSSEQQQYVVGHDLYEYIPPYDHNDVRTKLERVFREGSREQIEFLTTNEQGESAWYSNQYAPIWDGDMVREVAIIATNITPQKRVEEDLRQSEERYRDLFHSNPNAMWVIDIETLEFIDVNDAALRQYGYSRDEFLKLNITTIRPAEETEETLQRMDMVRRGDVTERTGRTLRHLKKDGSLLYVEVAFHRLTYLGRDALVVAAYDLTEREKTAQALVRSEELFSTIFQAVPVALSITSLPDGRVTKVNDYLLKLTGYEPGDLIGKTNLRVPLWYDRAQRQLVARLSNQADGFDGVEFQWRKKSGEVVNVIGSARQAMIGGELCVIGMAADITDRKQTEEALRRSESLLSKVFQLVPVAIAISTVKSGQILSMNPFQLELLGYESHDVINHTVHEIGYWVDLELRHKLVEQLRTGGSVQGVEGQWRTHSGDIRDMLISFEAIDIEGQDCVLGIGIDITDLKQADEDRLEAEKLRFELEKEREVLVLKDRFISTMSHEFRTPLAVVLAAKEALEHYYDRMKPERRTEHFANIAEQVRYLTDLLDEILTVSKARAGKMQFQPVPMDLTDYCRKLFEQMRTTDKGRHQFIFDSRDLPDVVEADKVLLQHILINLLSNAVKYSPVESMVALHLSCTDSSVMIQVRDEGIGIPENDQLHLFEPFYRASNVQSFEGTGLGLAIVKESAEAHGGSITCESTPGQGTLFTVRLPLR